MTIEDIVKSVSTMSDEEISARLHEIRTSRSSVKEVSSTKRPTKKVEKVEGDISVALGKLSAKDRQMLLALMGGK